MRKLLNQKGLTTFELLILTPLALYFFFAIITTGIAFDAKGVVIIAAREASRQAAALDEYNKGSRPWQKAVDTVSGSLPSSWSVGTSVSGIKKTFSPSVPNPDEPDVVITKENGYYTAVVTYHAVTPAPGLPKLLNSDASWMEKYITIKGKASFPVEEGG